MGKSKLKGFDGLGPKEIRDLRNATRLVWQRSHARKLVVKRCTGEDGYAYCEECASRTPKLKVDHIVKVGDLDSGYIPRLMVPSSKLQGLCPTCHNAKTKAERAEGKPKTAKGKRKTKPKKDIYDLGF